MRDIPECQRSSARALALRAEENPGFPWSSKVTSVRSTAASQKAETDSTFAAPALGAGM